MGDCYYYGKKVEEDEEQAFIWYKKAAEQGHADAEYSLGWCYEYGEGVEKDEKKAFDCYVRSSGKGCVTAQFRIGSCYENGVGVSEDLKQAFCWYRKAAENGNADAQYSLGWCYEYGEGIAKNDQQAFKWYKKSAENGNAEAQEILISHYNYGVGVWKKNDDDENDGNIDESFLENNGKSLKTEETISKKRLEDYEEFPLINEALAKCNYYSWERARDMAGTIIGGGFLCGFFIGLALFNLKKDFTFLSFINDIPTYCVVIFFIIFNPITTIILANIIDGYIESNQKVILDAVIDGLEIEVPYPVREEFTGRFSIL